eukprot:TRINITY_DN797_c0_g1_i1.p1 TRINITY_DN797_c0_g1~~TRINITY_DN797_c0_g1_i1.p1  ORF type:complete len:741 (+),score=180.87 TRINITY_DN797_c0_g1_i1:137-2359(+)
MNSGLNHATSLAERLARDIELRKQVSNATRILVKVGSSLIVDSEGRICISLFGNLIDQVSRLVKDGKQIILVSSGSIALGKQILRSQNMGRNPTDREAAAAGQMKIMAVYDYLFQLKGVPASQILLANDDFFVEPRINNLKGTIDNLLHHGVIPVLNENDVTTYHNGKMMLLDNDSLASMISIILGVEVTILLTDVDGLFKYPPNQVPEHMNEIIHTFSRQLEFDLNGKSSVGRGGMASKIDAAYMAVNAANSNTKAVIIASGHRPNTIHRIVGGELVGTLFMREKHTTVLTNEICKADNEESLRVNAHQMAIEAREASRIIATLTSKERAHIVQTIASRLLSKSNEIVEANKLDIIEYEKQPEFSKALRSRLELTRPKLETLCEGIQSLARSVLTGDQLGRTLSVTEISDGLQLEKVTCPIGVILVIFESRPDSLPQISTLNFLAGNGLLLKGGKEANRTNKILHKLIVDTIHDESQGRVSRSAIGLVESREEISSLLRLDSVIDLVIPRGSQELVNQIQQNTKIPVLGHSAGICHVYLDSEADLEKSVKIAVDSKCDYPAACNAAETLLIHRDLISNGISAKVLDALRHAGVSLFGGPKAEISLKLPAAPSLKTEYGDLRMSVEIVENLEEAIRHINSHGSSHTDTIVSENSRNADTFLNLVDSACVFHNCSTRFADGFRFGLGAEVGISTGRIHARGPVGIEGLLTTKFKLRSKKGDTVAEFSNGKKKYTHRPLSKL